MGTVKTNSKSEKELYDVIYVSDEELNIKIEKESKKKERPCIIVKIDQNRKLYYVLLFTSKKYNNVRQIKIKNRNSYINLVRPQALTKNIIDYANIAKIHIDDFIIERIEDFINYINI